MKEFFDEELLEIAVTGVVIAICGCATDAPMVLIIGAVVAATYAVTELMRSNMHGQHSINDSEEDMEMYDLSGHYIPRHLKRKENE